MFADGLRPSGGSLDPLKCGQNEDGTVGWTEEKKCSPIDSGILGAHADIYRRLLGQKNPGPYFIKLRSRGIVVLWYYKHYNGSFSQLQMGISENFP